MTGPPARSTLAGLALLLVALLLASLLVGPAPITAGRGLLALVTGADPTAALVMREILSLIHI